MKEKKALKKRNFFLIALFLTILLIQFIAAADVAYIYNKNFKIDNNVKVLLNQPYGWVFVF